MCAHRDTLDIFALEKPIRAHSIVMYKNNEIITSSYYILLKCLHLGAIVYYVYILRIFIVQ